MSEQPVNADGADSRAEDGPGKPRPSSSAAGEHDSAGLEAARWVAAGLRRLPGRRPRSADRARYGPAEMSGAHPDARDPAPLGAAVDKLVADHDWATDLAVHAVFGRWAAIVGSDVAAHSRPESFRDGHVTVRTDSTAWATQLKLLAPTVVRRLNEDLGHGTVSRIDVVGPEAPSWRRGRRAVRGGRGPRDTYG